MTAPHGSRPPDVSGEESPGLLRRFARACYRRRRLVVVTWIVAVAALTVLGQAFGATFQDEFELPGSESQDAFELLEEEGFASLSGFSGQLVFRAPDGVDDAEVRSAMQDLFDRIEGQVEGVEVTSPYSPGGERLVSDSGEIAYAQVDVGELPTDEVSEAGEEIRTIVDDTDVPGARVELGGDIFVEEAEFASEAVGLTAAAVILLVAFGSVLAMGLPIVTALAGIGTGIALVALYGHLVTLPTFANQAVAMIGIGVGIDYALFIVTRFREGLQDGLEPEEAAVQAVDTAGRAVLLAGTTVIIAVLGLLTMGVTLIQGLAAGVSIGVLMTMTAALTLLPAVLGFVGRNVDRLGLPHRRRAQERGGEQSVWYRWSRLLQRRPWPPLAIGVALLGVVTVPLLGMRLGFADASNRPESDTTRRAYDLLAEGFGPGANGPFLLAAELPDGSEDMAVIEELQQRLEDTEGVAEVSPALPNEDTTAAVMQVIPTTAPQAEETTELVHHLRDDVVPAATAGSDVRVLVGGVQAAVVDFAEYTASRMPWFVGVVLALSFVLLMAVFRSLVVAAEAVAMNLLSVGAAYGATVAVFQWGWLGSLGIESGPIEPWVPMMMFAIVFGLSIDYEVFLLSRIREDYVRTGDNATAVANGLALTARVITAAAAIMFCVFGSFVLGQERALRLFGFGLAVAIALDASVVRLMVVPSLMELLGDRNWWLPRWIGRVLPAVQVSSRHATADAGVTGDGDAREPGEPSEPVGAAGGGRGRSRDEGGDGPGSRTTGPRPETPEREGRGRR